MKKSVFILFTLLFVFAACSDDKKNEPDPVEQNEPNPVDELDCIKLDEPVSDYEQDFVIFEEYFGDWDTTVFYQEIYNSETYNLLENLIDYIDKNQIRLIYYSNFNYPSVTKFNEYVCDSEEAAAFFNRDDCVSVLISTFLYRLKMGRYKMADYNYLYWNNAWSSFFEYILKSEISMSKMNVTEKVQLMVLALEKYRYGFICVHNDSLLDGLVDGFYRINQKAAAENIMISIMLSNDYTPFVKDVKPILVESTQGAMYSVPSTYMAQTRDYFLFPRYARQFINDNK